MNYKGIPHRTVRLDGADIENTCIAEGVPPLDHREDGSPHYTVPVLVDATNPTAPVKVVDSKAIIEYIDTTYPDPNSGKLLFPKGTEALQALAFDHTAQVRKCLFQLSVEGFYLKQCGFVKQRFENRYLEVTSSAALERKEARDAWWKDARSALEKLGGYMDKNPESIGGEKGFHFIGRSFSFLDLSVGADLIMLKLCVGEAEFASEMKDCDGGRWIRLTEAVWEFI